MAFVEYAFRCKSMGPLLMHSCKAMMVPKGNGATTKAQSIPSPEKEAEAGTYRIEKTGELYLPTVAFRKSLIGGSSGRKFGKMQAKTVLMGSAFCASVESILLDPKTLKPMKEFHAIDTRPVIINKARVLRSRPIINEWSTDVLLKIDEDFLSADNIVELFKIAGRTKGVGDFRLEKGGEFGMYTCEGATPAGAMKKK